MFTANFPKKQSTQTNSALNDGEPASAVNPSATPHRTDNGLNKSNDLNSLVSSHESVMSEANHTAKISKKPGLDIEKIKKI